MKDNKKESKIILFLRNNKKLILSMLIFNIFFFILMFSSVLIVNADTPVSFDITTNNSCDINNSNYYYNYFDSTDIDTMLNFHYANSSYISDNYIIQFSTCSGSASGGNKVYDTYLIEFNGDLIVDYGDIYNTGDYEYFTSNGDNVSGTSKKLKVWSFGYIPATNSISSASSYSVNVWSFYSLYSDIYLIDTNITSDISFTYNDPDINIDYNTVYLNYDNGYDLTVDRGDSIPLNTFAFFDMSFGVPPLDRINLGVNGDSVLFYFKDYSTLSSANYNKTFNVNGLYEIYNFNFNNFVNELDSPNFYLQYNTHYYKPTSEIGLRYGNRDLAVWGTYIVDDLFELIYQNFDGLGNTAPLFKAIYNVGEYNMPSVKNYYYIDLDLSNVGYVIFDYNGYVIATDNIDNSISYIDSDSNNVVVDLSPYVVPDSNLFDNIGSSFNNFLAPIGSIFHLVDYGVVNSGEIIQPFIFIILFLGVMYFVVKALL